MSRYIDADKFLQDEIKRCGRVPLVGCCTTDNESLAYLLAKASTADVVEGKYGRWKGAGLGDYLCSECWEVYSGGNEFKYCPNCGAKMDGR